MGLGFSRRAGGYQTQRGTVLVPSLLKLLIYMEGFLIRGWYFIFPGWHRLHEPEPVSNQPVGLGLQPRTGRYRPGGPPFSSPGVGVVDTWKNFCSGDGTVYSPGATGVTSPSQTAISQLGWRFYAVRGSIKPRGPPFSSPACWSCRCMQGFLTRKWYLILPTWRWLHEPEPISNQPVELGFPHRTGRYRPGRPPFSSAGVGVVDIGKDL